LLFRFLLSAFAFKLSQLTIDHSLLYSSTISLLGLLVSGISRLKYRFWYSSIRITPTDMAESARLNIGWKIPKPLKSGLCCL
jgi:hypothetical protein